MSIEVANIRVGMLIKHHEMVTKNFVLLKLAASSASSMAKKDSKTKTKTIKQI